MEKIFRFFGLIFIIVGIMAVYAGYAYRLPNAEFDSRLWSFPMLDDFVSFIREQPYGVRSTLKINVFGLFPSFVGVGVAFVLLSFPCFYGARWVIRAGEWSTKDTLLLEETGTIALPSKEKGISVGSDSGKIPVAPTEQEQPEEDLLFSDIGKIIALSQSAIDGKQETMVLKKLLPEVLPYCEHFSSDFREKLVKQSLSYYTINKKRAELGISPDQFRIQDTRMNELGMETIGRRFMPKDISKIDPSALHHVGRAYTVFEQSEIQQETLGLAQDWQDLSLRNVIEMMRMITAADVA